jgi:hypothetical protein
MYSSNINKGFSSFGGGSNDRFGLQPTSFSNNFGGPSNSIPIYGQKWNDNYGRTVIGLIGEDRNSPSTFSLDIPGELNANVTYAMKSKIDDAKRTLETQKKFDQLSIGINSNTGYVGYDRHGTITHKIEPAGISLSKNTLLDRESRHYTTLFGDNGKSGQFGCYESKYESKSEIIDKIKCYANAAFNSVTDAQVKSLKVPDIREVLCDHFHPFDIQKNNTCKLNIIATDAVKGIIKAAINGDCDKSKKK